MAPPTKYATEEEKREARNASKKRYYERHRESEQEKARQRWRARKEREREEASDVPTADDDSQPRSLSYPSGRNNELHATESSAVTQRRYSSARDGSPSASTSGSDRSYSPAATTLSPLLSNSYFHRSFSPGPLHSIQQAVARSWPPSRSAPPVPPQTGLPPVLPSPGFGGLGPSRPSSPSDRLLHPRARDRQPQIPPSTASSPAESPATPPVTTPTGSSH